MEACPGEATGGGGVDPRLLPVAEGLSHSGHGITLPHAAYSLLVSLEAIAYVLKTKRSFLFIS